MYYSLAFIEGIFVLTVVVVNRGMPLPYAVNFCALAIAVALRLTPLRFLVIVWEVARDPVAIELILAVVLIRWLGGIMNGAGGIKRSSDLLQQLIGDWRYVSSVIPFIVGLLVIPGGAILSAPTVQQLTANKGLGKPKQAAINLTFRHVGQIFYPMSPSMLLLTSMVGVDLSRQTLYHLPVALGIWVISFWYFFGSIKAGNRDGLDKSNAFKKTRALLLELGPIFIVVAVFVLTRITVFALVVGIAWSFWWYRLDLRRLFASFQLRAGAESMLLILGTLIIRGILQKEILSVLDFGSVFQNLFPPLVLCLLPAIIAFFTGSVIAGISLSTPLLLSLLTQGTNPYLFSLAIFMASFVGYLVSPLHLCLSLTTEYYGTSLGGVYKSLTVPAILFFISAVISSLLFLI